MAHEFGSPAPIFRVADVRASLDYYIKCLGFSLDWDEGGIASVTRDRCTIFLCEWDQGQRGTWAWIGVRDAEASHDEFKARGARIRHPPANFPWALKNAIEDLDGKRSAPRLRPEIGRSLRPVPRCQRRSLVYLKYSVTVGCKPQERRVERPWKREGPPVPSQCRSSVKP
jgi:hypothetical protein